MTPVEVPIWCPRCETHLALPHQRLCPVCRDMDAQARKDPK